MCLKKFLYFRKVEFTAVLKSDKKFFYIMQSKCGRICLFINNIFIVNNLCCAIKTVSIYTAFDL
ncbi:hypothetical protein C1I72_03190 [Ehrlichia canis]|nr:hypothetical protein C1I72_03190 [Ehrlichia canis]